MKVEIEKKSYYDEDKKAEILKFEIIINNIINKFEDLDYSNKKKLSKLLLSELLEHSNIFKNNKFFVHTKAKM